MAVDDTCAVAELKTVTVLVAVTASISGTKGAPGSKVKEELNSELSQKLVPGWLGSPQTQLSWVN